MNDNPNGEDATVELTRAIIEHLRGAPDDWVSLSLIIGIQSRRPATSYGYAYTADGQSCAVASRPSGLFPTLTKYLDEKYQPDERVPVKLLVQFNRDSGGYLITFEDTDTSRWQVTPENVYTIQEQLRPNI